ncbi:His/Gly/Thr/Pro-type tRNA ligase C-terminal domain-containing protein [Candidatus Parcubacteria bacterium]|nr:His/Gly/Thr/Pro-type tRNA ligase C-terminal domain-containing protein [Candidatus Parcubacteria bacterium]
MRQSELFTKTRREAPKDEVAKNAQLLIRAGYVHKEMAGVYSYLPLGLRVLNNIIDIIRQEMNAIGGKELILTTLQKKEVWEKVNRWDDEVVDVWFKTRLKDSTELGLGFTHDEQLVNVLTEHIQSYKDLPVYVYQIQTKFRNELRSKSGIMRGREFLMKDLYSFNRTEEEQDAFYSKVMEAYMNVFKRCGIEDKTYVTFATGGTFSQFSHEFQTLSEEGEDTVYLDQKNNIAINEEVMSDEVLAELGVHKKDLVQKKSIEVGNIFKQGTKFTDPFGLYYQDERGESKSIYMGGYGIGVTRLMGTIVEVLSDEKGIVWPECVAPYTYHLLSLLPDDAESIAFANTLYADMEKRGMSVLYDDRAVRAGEKFADSDLIGIPWRVNVGKETASSGMVELVSRATGEVKKLSRDELLAR